MSKLIYPGSISMYIFSSQEYLKAKPNLMLSTNPSSVVFDLTTESTLALVPSSHDLKGIALHPWL